MRLLLALGFLIALAATALVVIAEDVRLLRLAAVLALWAALIAAFAVTRSRRDARAAAMREDEAQLAYQLELHREVAARREYEADLTRQLANEQSDQLGELREQLDRLTGVLASLVDGEVTVSRLTLSAESARFRPGSGAIAAGPSTMVTGAGGLRAIGDGANVDTIDAAPPVDADARSGAGAGAPAWTDAGDRERVDAPAAAWARRHADLVRESRTAEPAPAPARPPAAPPVPAAAPAPAHAAHPAPAPARPEPVPVAPAEPVRAAPAEPVRAAPAEPVLVARPEPAPAAWPEPVGGDAEAPGEHETGGVSVSDLLAAYGLSGTGRRRRRD